MPGYEDNNKFTRLVMGEDDLLDRAIEWITMNLDPTDVFSDGDLEGWAKDNAAHGLSPDEVFTGKELSDWAEDEGYKMPEE